MVQWIAILAVLVFLSDSSLSRSWVSFDNDDDYESGLADSDDEPNWKSKYHRGGDSWESDEEYEEPGYGSHQPAISNHGYHNDHYHHGFEHQYHGNHHYNHQGHGRMDDNKNFRTPNVYGNPGHNTEASPNSNWGQYGPGGSKGNCNQENGQGHPGHHSGHPSQNGYPGHDYGSHGYSNHNSGSFEHPSQTGSPAYPGGTGTPAKPGINSGSLGLNQNNQQGSGNNGDRVVFPDFKNQDTTTTREPPTPSLQPPETTAPTPTATTTTDQTLLDLVICIRACPVTAEYNPVCGSNNVTYNNPGVLQCARNCGLDVTIARRAPCSQLIPRLTSTMTAITNSAPSVTTTTAQVATTTTESPTATPDTVKPTRFTNIDVIPVNKPDTTLIPLDVLQGIFGSAPPSTPVEPEFDIDKRKINRT